MGAGSGLGESDGTSLPRIPRNTDQRENRRYLVINWARLRPAQLIISKLIGYHYLLLEVSGTDYIVLDAVLQ